MAGERGTNTQPIGMVTIEIAMVTIEIATSEKEREEKRDRWMNVDGVVMVRRMVQHTGEQEVGPEEKSQPEVFLRVGRYMISTRVVGN